MVAAGDWDRRELCDVRFLTEEDPVINTSPNGAQVAC
jgi:hypothetical protein